MAALHDIQNALRGWPLRKYITEELNRLEALNNGSSRGSTDCTYGRRQVKSAFKPLGLIVVSSRWLLQAKHTRVMGAGR